MFLRALFAFLVLPGIVAFAAPICWLVATSHTTLAQPLGLLPLLVGCVGLLWCVRDFYVLGKGTLAPWSPPQQLVTAGLYRRTVAGAHSRSRVGRLRAPRAPLAMSCQVRSQ